MRLRRIVSSLKSPRTTKNEGDPGIQERSSGPGIANPQRWHEEIKRCGDVLEFLFNGRPPIDAKRAISLSVPTLQYLVALNPNLGRPSHECDQILISLLDEHASNDPSTLCVAILACFQYLSPPVAAEHLSSLVSLDIDRYLRCIHVASQIRLDVISSADLKAAQLLLPIVTGQARGLQEFGPLIHSLALLGTSIYLPLQTVHHALAKSHIRARLQSQIHALLKQQQFMSAFQLISWLKIVTTLPNNGNALALLDAHFQDWPWLAAWRPNIDRIGVWERGEINQKQRQKLIHVFELDGPDIVTHQQSSLKLAQPRCYEHVKLNPENAETLERFLDLLYKACLVGTHAVDLVIQQCIGKVISADVMSMIDGAVQTGEDSQCKSILDFGGTLAPHKSLADDVQAFIEFLPNLEQPNTWAPHKTLMGQLADRLCQVMGLAQKEVCRQLRLGLPADYMGMLVYDFGTTILKCPRIHTNLPPELLEKIRQFPKEQTLEAIFDELQDDSEHSAAHSSRFRSYLLSSLGGEGTTESVKLSDVQDEIRFWKHPPDQSRKDLAKKLGEISGLEYSLYTTCLNAMLQEHDLYIAQMKGNIIPDDEESGLKFANYLAYRRKLNQMQNPCWLLLTATLLKSQKTSFLSRKADSTSFVEWDKLVGDLEQLLTPIQDQLPESGSGLTRERMLWWKTLSNYAHAVRFLLDLHGQQRSMRWLYFPTSSDHVMPLLRVASQGDNMSSLNRQIISYLRRNGSNAVEVCDCIRLLVGTSSLGMAVCERFLSREEVRWAQSDMHTVFIAWASDESLTSADRAALESVRVLLRIRMPSEVRLGYIRSTNEVLQSEYEVLFQAARHLESSRLRLQHKDPRRVPAVLSQIGVESNAIGRVVDEQIPDELVDAIDEIGESEYELSFALTGLSSLQRLARGIHKDSRMFLIRLSLLSDPQFCVHFSPNDEGQERHRYCRPKDSHEPPTMLCSTKPTLFTYYLGRNVYQILRNGKPSLQEFYKSIESLITAHPSACLVCSSAIGTKLWKPASCSVHCSRKLRQAPLEVRLHNLLIDPAAIDLLLTCVYAAAADTTNLDLLPGCPVTKGRITAVIDTFPVLTTYQTAHNLKAAIQGSDGFGKEREDLLSWLSTLR